MRPVPRINSVSPVNTRSARQVGIAVVGVAGRIEHVEPHALDLDAIAFGDAHRHDVGMGLLAHHRDAMGAVAQRAEPGDVIGVQMGIDRLDQLEVKLAHELQVAIDLFQHRIDDQRLAALPAGEEIGVGAGRAVEELTENHGRIISRNAAELFLRSHLGRNIILHKASSYLSRSTGRSGREPHSAHEPS